ncbi:MAG TPA: endonuclease/exonuclease/phosphatase family protein [Patescibacteria group bacterium]|nr:endonuclease/exonuclease/phosphatase family protein [Patescibacteria group bacterium]
MSFKILFSNIGYARGIDGTLWQHVGRFNRHFYCPVPLQQEVLMQVKGIVKNARPDICCFVEIDQGSMHSARFNQLTFLMDDDYRFFDIADKYGPGNWLAKLPLHTGKSSAFMSRTELPFDKHYFSKGSKRLIHKVAIPGGVTLFFTHFSLQRKVRLHQFQELRKLVEQQDGPVIVLADFNIMHGFKELQPLLENSDLIVLNDEHNPTFRLHRTEKALDLCICSKSLREKLDLKIIQQPFSDHAALLVEGNW